MVGIDLGGTKCLAVALDADGAPIGEPLKVATPKGQVDVLDTLAGLVEELRTRTEVLAGVGVGVPGWVDRNGVLQFAPNLVDVRNFNVVSELCRRVGVPVHAENDATCAAWGEYQAGAGRGAQDMVLVTLGTGIGAGIVIGGRLYRGANGFAGEVGHMVVDAHGPPCGCGREGCWEVFGSGRGLRHLAREASRAGNATGILEAASDNVDCIRSEHVTEAARRGDAEAKAIMERFAWWVALGLFNLANAFDPEVVVLGGGLAAAGETLLDPTKAALAALLTAAAHRPPVPIATAVLGDRAGAIGAAYLAYESQGASSRNRTR